MEHFGNSLSVHNNHVKLNGVEINRINDLQIQVTAEHSMRVRIDLDITDLNADFSESPMK